MENPRAQISRLMRRVRQSGQLPTSASIVSETFDRLSYVPGAVTPESVLINFSKLLRNLWEQTLPVLEEYEKRSYSEGIPREFISEFPDVFEEAERVASQRGFEEGVTNLFGEWYPMLRRAFLSVSQSRMQRGGKDFELQIEGLLDLAQIPYHKQEIENRTDLILPSLEIHQLNPTISAVVSVKRTLRERWAEVAEELFNLRSPNVFLFTADENVTANHVVRICGQYKIHLVVWDSEKRKKFPTEPLVLGYTEWATERLGALRSRWE